MNRHRPPELPRPKAPPNRHHKRPHRPPAPLMLEQEIALRLRLPQRLAPRKLEPALRTPRLRKPAQVVPAPRAANLKADPLPLRNALSKYRLNVERRVHEFIVPARNVSGQASIRSECSNESVAPAAHCARRCTDRDPSDVRTVSRTPLPSAARFSAPRSSFAERIRFLSTLTITSPRCSPELTASPIGDSDTTTAPPSMPLSCRI